MSRRRTVPGIPVAVDIDDLVAVHDAPPGTGRGFMPKVTRWTTHFVDAVAPWIDRLVGHGAPWARLTVGKRILVGWLVTRAVMLLLLALPQRTIINDVLYYADNLQQWSDGQPLSEVLDEYPAPVLVLVGLPWLLSFGNHTVYATLFVVMMLAIDALFCWLLYKQHRGHQGPAVTLWLAAGPMMGPLAVTRFDVVPGILAGAAVLLLGRRPALSSVFIVMGAALKLWPAALLPALAAPSRTRWRVIVGAVVSGLVVVAGTVAVGGLDRLLSPLTWQSDRGLQIESLIALPLMIPWSIVHDPWTVDFTRFITSEIWGPGDTVLLKLATLLTVAAGAGMLTLWYRAWRRGKAIGAETVGWIMLTTIGLLILSNKVFSPQYLLWLSPVAIAMVAIAPRGDSGVRRFVVLLLCVGVLTQIIYPVLYLWISEIYWANPLGVALLALRDVFLVGFVVYAWRRSWSETAPTAEPAPDSVAATG